MIRIIGFFLIFGVTVASLSDFMNPGAPILSVVPILLGNMVADLGPIIIDANGDMERIKRGEKLDYFEEVLKRWWLLIYAGFFGYFIGAILLTILFNMVWYWISFDIILKIKMFWRWNHIGTTAVLDRIFKGNIYLQWTTKLILIVGIWYLIVNQFSLFSLSF